MRIRYTNPLDRPLKDLSLMLWPNDEQYAAEMQAGPAVVDGRVVVPEPEKEGVGLRVPLRPPLAPGEVVDLTVSFRVVTTDPITLASPKRFGISEGMLLAPTFYPLVPRLTPDGEWQVMPAPPGGDTTNSDVAFYDVHLTVPEELTLVATGIELERTPASDGTVVVRYASGPVRDFAFALGPFVPAQAQAGEVVARAWALPEHAAQAESLAETAASALQAFEAWIGPYPYDELDVIDAPGAFGGIEYPGLIFIGVVGDRADDDVVIHEVAHQWFYALIGNDQLLEPWLDEGAASYLETLYYEAVGDVRTATRLLDENRRILRAVGRTETPIGLGVGEYPSERDYAVFVYLKGALFFDALRGQLGEPGFRTFLQTYFTRLPLRLRYGAGVPGDGRSDLRMRPGGPVRPVGLPRRTAADPVGSTTRHAALPQIGSSAVGDAAPGQTQPVPTACLDDSATVTRPANQAISSIPFDTCRGSRVSLDQPGHAGLQSSCLTS